MASSDLIRWGGLATMGGGVLFLLYSLLGVATGRGDESSPLDLLAILGYVLLIVGLVGFHALQQRNYGRIGRAGLYTTIAAFLLWEVLLLAGLLGGGEALPEWLVTVGVLGTLVGEVLYGAATLQARVLPRWCGILFIILMPGTILFSFLSGDFSSIWVGLVWIALGYGLWSIRGAAVGQPTRVRRRV
jgi:hypothetical protein